MRIGGLLRGDAGRDALIGLLAPSSEIRRDGGEGACIEGVADSLPPNRDSTDTFASRSDRLFRSIIGPP